MFQLTNSENNLSCLIKEFNTRRDRCDSIVAKLSDLKVETVKTCNICEANNILILSISDRYGIPIRSGMCTNCGLIFLIDKYTEEGYSKFYQNYYRPLVSAYLGRVINSSSMQKEQTIYGQKLVNTFQRVLDLDDNHSLIDVGGSTGLVAVEFVKEYGVSATVLDPSPEEVAVAEKRGLNTICDLFESWEWDGQQYDLVLCCRTIDHFFDLKQSMSKLHDICKPTGYLLIDIIDVEVIRRIKGVYEGSIKVDHPYYLCSEIAPAIFAKSGFEIVLSEISTSYERVTYVCRPTQNNNIEVSTDHSWITKRIRSLQENRLDVFRSSRLPCSWREAVHRWIYYKKQDLKNFIGI